MPGVLLVWGVFHTSNITTFIKTRTYWIFIKGVMLAFCKEFSLYRGKMKIHFSPFRKKPDIWQKQAEHRKKKTYMFPHSCGFSNHHFVFPRARAGFRLSPTSTPRKRKKELTN